MTIEIVDFPIKNGGSFNSYVKLPEGNSHWYISQMLHGAGIFTYITYKTGPFMG